ncbi:MAG TPA: FecR domain-containing protein [Gemmatimonadaceae bacterium]|nr:FecR domain-containing protein [Gemmatimonadaceae bacterium]
MSQPPDDELLDRYLSGSCTPDEEKGLERWASERAGRLEALRAMKATLGAHERGGEREAPEPEALAVWAWLERAMHEVAPAPGTGATPRLTAVKAATPRKPLVLHGSRSGWRAAIWMAAAAAVLLVATPTLLRMTGRPPSLRQAASVAMREVVTGNAERATVQLADGSKVMLAAASRLRYPEQFDRIVTRTIVLEGEAYFEVAHNAERPFVVHAAHAVTRVLGTSFSVRAYGSDSAVRVVVASGRVALGMQHGDSTGRHVLRQGELGRLSESGAAVVEQVEAAKYLAWTEGRLAFDDTPLPEVGQQLERWYDVDIVLADSSLAHRRFTGTFAGESLEQLLSVLTPPVHARYERRGRSIVLHALSETP